MEEIYLGNSREYSREESYASEGDLDSKNESNDDKDSLKHSESIKEEAEEENDVKKV